MTQEKKTPGPAVAEGEEARARLLEHYSEKAADHMIHPRHMERIVRPDGYARATAEDGEIIEFFLRLDDEVIAECTFQTTACAATLACASAAAELAQNKPLNKVLEVVTAEGFLRELDGLPEGNIHCCFRVAAAFRQAVADAVRHKAEPWKKLYRKT